MAALLLHTGCATTPTNIMKNNWILIISLFWAVSGSCQEPVSKKVFDNVVLVNKIDFVNPKFDQPKFSCAFLLKYNDDTFAVTAKHLLKIIKPDDMATLSFKGHIKEWSLYALDDKNQKVFCDQLLNENSSESLEAKSTYDNDWLLFSIKENLSNIKPLEIRTTPLVPSEKLYVVGWTRTMESGPQRVYEFEYYKTISNRILLKDLIVPKKLGGLSGAPVLDENGLLVGIVSNGTVDPESNEKFFSPCAATTLLSFLKGQNFIKTNSHNE